LPAWLLAFAELACRSRGNFRGKSTASAKKGIVGLTLASVSFRKHVWLLGTHVIPATGAYATVGYARVAAFVTLGILEQSVRRSDSGAKPTAQAAGTPLDTGHSS